MSRIDFVGSTAEFRGFVEAAFAGGAPIELVPVDAPTYDPLTVEQIVDDEPDLLVVGPAIGDADALKLIEDVLTRAPHIPAVLIANPTADLWPLALRAGVRDVLTPLTGLTTIRESFERSMETGRRLRGAVATTPAVHSGGRVLTVVSPKGGSGKTTVAANLAATIARRRRDDVVLADFDVQFGDVNHAYRLDPEYSILHASAPGVSPTMLKGFLTPHSSGVLALTAPDRPEDADDIDAASATGTITDLASLFGCVVVDTAAGLEDLTLSVLEATTDVIFVTSTDVPSVRAVVKEIDLLGRMGLLKDLNQHLVLNRADARVGLSVSDIEETIGMSAGLKIPSTRAIPTALNLGEPAVLSDERSGLARTFTKFAEGIGVIPQVADTGRNWRLSR